MTDGKPSVRLRRDVEGSRNIIYNDLYYAEIELDETEKVNKFEALQSDTRKSRSLFCLHFATAVTQDLRSRLDSHFLLHLTATM